ncbi:DEAD/DEAH box helicase [Clostridium chromiireducens]|uniref:ATP-dependent RNA helicase DbpA n=1 Tax=Clostridium chromiireducens TaxID=225345 RepID=A0A964RR83_9CLOT|nr:DEAD/DEAH box helicase [Clostridium chromiireducens]MVX66494.1 DEAD/DEAH box helicase [Clostridium chromiireducens]
MIKEDFNDYHLSSELLKAISMLNFKKLTKVQEQVIPIALTEKDIVVKSQTGSGKTAAYAIPICQLVDWEENKPQALVLTPTRELAIQVKEDFFNIGRFKRIKAAAIYGKSPFYDQEKELKQKTHIVVGTPGRIIDHIEKGTFDLSKIKYLIIDEADEMLNMGFVEQIETIIKSLSKERMTMLLSATMPKDIETLCNKYMKDPIHIEIEGQNKSTDNICQERYNVNELDKIELLRDINILENPDSCIIFCNTKQKVDEVYTKLSKLQYNCRKIHGGMEQSDRLRVMNNFKLGYFRYLIATDVAARGIDIDNITHVINYDIPEDKESYVHRIGRTGRAGKKGRAITFVAQNESKFLNDIHEYIGKEIVLKERPSLETVNNLKEEFALKMNTKPEIKESKGSELSKEIMKLHINAGKKTKMRAVDIVGTLCNIEGMTKDDIGIINIVDISTFVEILNNKGEWVFQQLQKTPIKGRLRTVSKVDI